MAECACGSRHACPALVPSFSSKPIDGPLKAWLREPHKIPRIVHQTWKTCSNISHLQSQWRSGCSTMNSDWEWWLWSDEDNRRLIAEHYPWFLDTYDAYQHPITRVDAVRLFYLHRFGGLYLDLDFACLHPIDQLMPQPDGHAIFSYQYPDQLLGKIGAVANNVMAAPPGHPFFTRAISDLQRSRNASVLFAAGPNFLTSNLRMFADYAAGQKSSLTKGARNSSATTIYSMPLFYSNTWDRPRVGSCGLGTPAELETCKKRHNSSIFTTFWTNTWKPKGTAIHFDQLYRSRTVNISSCTPYSQDPRCIRL